MKTIFDKIKRELSEVQENILFKDYTTYKIGGPAKYFFIAKTKEELTRAIKAAKKFKLPVFIFGGGSNLLVSDKGFKGLVVKVDISDMKVMESRVTVGAGVNTTILASTLAERGISGLEWAAGLPGTIGGAVYGHAQAFGEKISDDIKNVEAVNLKTLKVKTFAKDQCNFSLKNSIFKKNRNWVIVSVEFEFRKNDVAQIKAKIKENLSYRKTHHPVTFPSAGSIFVNPQRKIKNKKLVLEFPELKIYNEKGAIPAGYLILKSGLSGKKIGKAQISEKHSNFIINLGGATAKDVLFLIKLSKEKVMNKFNIELEQEVQLVGFGK